MATYYDNTNEMSEEEYDELEDIKETEEELIRWIHRM